MQVDLDITNEIIMDKKAKKATTTTKKHQQKTNKQQNINHNEKIIFTLHFVKEQI